MSLVYKYAEMQLILCKMIQKQEKFSILAVSPPTKNYKSNNI